MAPSVAGLTLDIAFDSAAGRLTRLGRAEPTALAALKLDLPKIFTADAESARSVEAALAGEARNPEAALNYVVRGGPSSYDGPSL